MKSKHIHSMLALVAIAGFTHTSSAKEHHKGLTDALFAKKAAAGGLTEVQLGQLAQQNGGSQDVKDFGAKMVTDHGKANDALKAVAAKDSLTIPDKPTAEQQALIDKLSKKTGAAFDKVYIHAMVTAHKGDKALFMEEIASAKNPDLKQFAEETLPVIKEHLGMIEGMAGTGTGGHDKSMGAGSTMSPMPEPNVGSSGESKSGMAPGSTANPEPVTSPSP